MTVLLWYDPLYNHVMWFGKLESGLDIFYRLSDICICNLVMSG